MSGDGTAQAIKDLAANEEAHRKSAEFRQKYEAEKAARREARRELRIAVVCERCRRLRRGRHWTKAKPPADFVVVEGIVQTANENRSNRLRFDMTHAEPGGIKRRPRPKERNSSEAAGPFQT